MITLGSTPLFNITAGTAPIALDYLLCVGTELLLIDCFHLPLGTQHCNHSQDVGVRCLATSPGPGVWLYMLYKLITFAYEYTIIKFLIKPPQAFACLLDCLWHFSIQAQIPPEVEKLLEHLENGPR